MIKTFIVNLSKTKIVQYLIDIERHCSAARDLTISGRM